MNKIFPCPERETDRIVYALVHAAHELERRYDEALAPEGLTAAKFAALCKLVQAGRALGLGELADKLTCVRSNITQLVDRLETDGLVVRVVDPADRRTVRAEVTELGMKRQAEGAKHVERLLEAFSLSLKGQDLGAFENVLSALVM
ncbi:MAG TPA: MarR family transcriptional regulator [Burkholderiales bacterium]|nr:MarR family transcriptional regulator [Burkholderiales bacterium]